MIVNPLEFDERDEIILEKESEIEILNSHRKIYDQVQNDLDEKNQLLHEYEMKLLQFNNKYRSYEHEISVLKESQQTNDNSI